MAQPGIKSEWSPYSGGGLMYSRDENYFTNQEAQMGDVAIDTAKFQLQQQQEAWNLKKKQADNAYNLSTQFLSQWGGAMSTMTDMFSKAGSSIDNISKWLMEGSSAALPEAVQTEIDKIGDIQSTIMTKYGEWETEYAPMQKEFLGMAREESQTKRQLSRTLLEEGKAKPEAAAARARTDVAIQSEVANREAAREMASMGVDPSSGKFGALSRRGAVQTAGETVKAMNLARNAEKSRTSAINLQHMGMLKPSENAMIGINLGNQGIEQLKTAADLGKTSAGIIQSQQAVDLERVKTAGNIAGQYGNLATQYGSAIAQPYGEMAGYFLGKSGG